MGFLLLINESYEYIINSDDILQTYMPYKTLCS